MAEQQQQGMSAPFPTPPPFYKHFTKQNVTKLRQISAEAGAGAQSTSESNIESETKDVDILSLPPELRYLIPPQPPSESKFKCFGTELDLNAPSPTLQDSGIEQLYPNHPSVHQNPAPHLVALARSALTTFLALTGVLANNPELYESKVEDLQTIIYNMHELINRYRPHQARESLVLMLEERVERLKGEARSVVEAKAKVGKLLEGLKDGGEGMEVKQEANGAVHGEVGGDEVQQRREARQKAAWDVLQQEMEEF